MKFQRLIVVVLMLSSGAFAQTPKHKPVTPNASPEAIALLTYIQSIDGKHTLSGQHNFPISGDRNTQFVADYAGETPVVWSQDFGFAADGDKDSYLARPAIIKEAIRQHKLGAIITLCWHAVPPTAEEPVTFQPKPGFDSAKLESVQGKLLDKQFKDVLTPGTKLYKQWQKQVDEIASYLKQLQDAKVPVLWRPYHEMNGDWFWWGGRHEGKYTTAALYRQIFDRMVKYHKLNNLIWVWSIDRPSQPGREFNKYYPGTQYLDMLAIDIYGNDFNQSYYEGLLALSEGKPLTLGEVGNPPSLEILAKQPKWIYWVVWSGMAKGTPKQDYEKLVSDPRPLFMEDPAYITGVNEFRRACGLPPLSSVREANFTGEWQFNEYESKLQAQGQGAPYKLTVAHTDNQLDIKSISQSEWSDDEVATQSLPLDGSEVKSKGFNDSPRIQFAKWSPGRDTLTIDSKVSFNFGGQAREFKSSEMWFVQKRGSKLVIIRKSDAFGGGPPRTSVIVYNKKQKE